MIQALGAYFREGLLSELYGMLSSREKRNGLARIERNSPHS